MRIRALNRQNDWSDFGKGFIVKMRKNTCFLLALKHFIIRKYAQEFPIFHIYNLLRNSKYKTQKVEYECNQREIRKRSFYLLKYIG